MELTIKAIIRHLMVSFNTAPLQLWFSKDLVRDNGKFRLAINFNNLKK